MSFQTLTDKKSNITVTGSIPQNATLKVEEKKTIEADSSYTDMNAKAENGYLIFTTDHFSEYVISNTKLSSENTGNKNQATGVVLVLIPAAIAAAGIIISKKRK